MIAAAGQNNELGKDNDLLWHLPDDFKRFKRLTSGHKIIMGRKTFESIPKPLPNRTHIVITRDESYNPKFDAIVVHSLEEALALTTKDDLTYVIGGGEIYTLAEKHAHKIELTRVHGTFDDADTFFPEIDDKVWILIAEEFHPRDDRHDYSFSYLTYTKR